MSSCSGTDTTRMITTSKNALQGKIYVAGHQGLVGSALVRQLSTRGYTNLVTYTHSELDLASQRAAHSFFEREQPEYVFLAAAKVGGIYANATYPAEFLYENLAIQINVIHCAHLFGVKKLLFLGSSCIYPKYCSQPMKEEDLLTGVLEATNEPYAIAKIAGIKMCSAYNRQYGTNFLSAMPTNLYGPGDNYDAQNSHVLPALIRKAHEAKIQGLEKITVWGTGTPRREFLYSDDLADACVFLMEHYDAADISEFINIGSGEEVSIADLATLITTIVGYRGKIVFDASKPDGTPRKLLDLSKLAAFGWRSKTTLEDGIRQTYEKYVAASLCLS
jgi:GDP-L-fucose synthase